MGGRVFLNTHNVLRLNKKEYEQYCLDISKLLINLNITKDLYYIVKAIEEKDTFGDMDIVINNSISISTIKEYLLLHGYPTKQNSNVLSFLFNSFQIDLIFVSKDIYSYACNYFNYNDVGNLVGRLSKHYGFKHGWQGLHYVQRSEDTILHEYLLSTNYLDILNILELDVETFNKGFSTYIEMFDWLITSPKFISNIFEYENLNHTNRVRDKKRKTYKMFLDYLKEKEISSTIKLSFVEKEQEVLKYFPSLQVEIDKVNLETEKKRLVKIKFNGTIVKNLVGLEGKELGKFMAYFTSKYTTDWLLYSSAYIITKTIKEEYENKLWNLKIG